MMEEDLSASAIRDESTDLQLLATYGAPSFDVSGELQWRDDHGFYPAEPNGVYDQDYFQKYVGYSRTPMGQMLNKARLALVDHFAAGALAIDIGIGCGQFVKTRGPRTFGFDVNPIGVEWLKRRKLWRDPYEDGAEVLTFWDSLEHIEDPERILAFCDSMAIISIPIFKDKAHIMRSKHFRTDEHFWYFTSEGLIRMMHNEGFRLVDQNDLETKLGRQDIRSFVFQR